MPLPAVCIVMLLPIPATAHTCPYLLLPAERNMTDKFVIKGSDVGEIQKIVIRHDNAGMGPDWHLQQVSYVPCMSNTRIVPVAG